MAQEDRNGIVGGMSFSTLERAHAHIYLTDFNARNFRPREIIMAQLTKEATAKAVSEANSLFD